MPNPANTFRRLAKDDSAVSAVEFAVLLPVMLLLLLGSFDIARAIDVKNKTTLLSRTISDFVSQGTTISKTELDNVVLASKSVLYPYSDAQSNLKVRIESIRQIPNSSNYTVDWSYQTRSSGTPTITSVDNNNPPFVPPDTSVVSAKIEYTYNFKFAGFLLERFNRSSLTLESSTYMSPRWGTPVEATF
jgi:Flp pilus assembly protein TadG